MAKDKKAESNKFPPMAEETGEVLTDESTEQPPMEIKESQEETSELTGAQEIMLLRDPGIAHQQTLARLDKAITELKNQNDTLIETKDVLVELGEALIKRLDALLTRR